MWDDLRTPHFKSGVRGLCTVYVLERCTGALKSMKMIQPIVITISGSIWHKSYITRLYSLAKAFKKLFSLLLFFFIIIIFFKYLIYFENWSRLSTIWELLHKHKTKETQMRKFLLNSHCVVVAYIITAISSFLKGSVSPCIHSNSSSCPPLQENCSYCPPTAS